MSHDDFAVEEVPGLPGALPAGEELLWQGKPDWRSLAVHVLHVRKVGAYFALLAAWTVVDGLSSGASATLLTGTLAALAGSAALAIAILCWLAVQMARTTIYSITSARVVLRIGIALPMTVNLPFRVVLSAALRQRRDGSGDLLLELEPGMRIGYAVLWPHVRPWRFAQAQPLLRGLADPVPVAQLLATALKRGVGGSVAAPLPARPAGDADARPRGAEAATA